MRQGSPVKWVQYRLQSEELPRVRWGRLASETPELLHVIVTKDCVFFRYITNL